MLQHPYTLDLLSMQLFFPCQRIQSWKVLLAACSDTFHICCIVRRAYHSFMSINCTGDLISSFSDPRGYPAANQLCQPLPTPLTFHITNQLYSANVSSSIWLLYLHNKFHVNPSRVTDTVNVRISLNVCYLVYQLSLLWGSLGTLYSLLHRPSKPRWTYGMAHHPPHRGPFWDTYESN